MTINHVFLAKYLLVTAWHMNVLRYINKLERSSLATQTGSMVVGGWMGVGVKPDLRGCLGQSKGAESHWSW
jgi:hypothetical protein